MNTEIKSVITVEVSFNKKINLCSEINVINEDSLKFVQKLIVPTYLQSLDFDIDEFEINSRIVEIEVEKNFDTPSEISPKTLLWKYDEKNPKKYITE